jgi:hypothetical protein
MGETASLEDKKGDGYVGLRYDVSIDKPYRVLIVGFYYAQSCP